MMRWYLLILSFFACLQANSQLTYRELSVEYDSAIEFRNLKLIPIVRKPQGGGSPRLLSLAEALQSGVAVVSERGTASTENVHWLRINNRSNIPLFIASGEIILGGRQDRMVLRDTILAPAGGRDQYVSVMCVEEDRWSDKEKKFAYLGFANPALRKVVDQSHNQVLIWKEIFEQLDSNKIKSPTLAYASQQLDKKVSLMEAEYLKYFNERVQRSDSNWVGVVCMSGNRILGADVFISEGLFYSEWQGLLRGFVMEAIHRGKAVSVDDEQVKKYLDKFLTDEKSQEEYLKKNGKVFRYNKQVIHITAFGE